MEIVETIIFERKKYLRGEEIGIVNKGLLGYI
jgi:hypothetical protein